LFKSIILIIQINLEIPRINSISVIIKYSENNEEKKYNNGKKNRARELKND